MQADHIDGGLRGGRKKSDAFEIGSIRFLLLPSEVAVGARKKHSFHDWKLLLGYSGIARAQSTEIHGTCCRVGSALN